MKMISGHDGSVVALIHIFRGHKKDVLSQRKKI